MIIPNMGTKTTPVRSGIADALFSKVQQRVLGLLYGQPRRSYQSAELIRLAGGGTGGAHRVLTRLARAGLVTVTQRGNQKHYQANRESPVFGELRDLILKTVGLADPLRRSLARISGGINAAFVYGSVAKGADKSASDVDLMVISDSLGYEEVYGALQTAERRLARRINPNLMSLPAWRTKRAEKDSFVARIVARPRLFIIGSDDDVA
jgi:predicted nucleotidyltransferase